MKFSIGLFCKLSPVAINILSSFDSIIFFKSNKLLVKKVSSFNLTEFDVILIDEIYNLTSSLTIIPAILQNVIASTFLNLFLISNAKTFVDKQLIFSC